MVKDTEDIKGMEYIRNGMAELSVRVSGISTRLKQSLIPK
jgi:hypothetical protein